MKIFRLNHTFLVTAFPFKCSYQVFPGCLSNCELTDDQISKLVLEKQEMEWEKESLQHRIESVTKQHTDEFFCAVLWAFIAFLTLKMNLTFQGKYQVIAELKDKEINNLKEELKSLQVLSCSTFFFLLYLCFIVTCTLAAPFIPSLLKISKITQFNR
uniref:Uncharacterized protein n=1 Tax=Pundamilia nyererei TaxID=303518 RepID=A0A3B4FQL5_9CICH